MRKLKQMVFPKYYRFMEKHGDSYYIVNNFEEYQKLWLEILQERFDQGWYNWMKDDGDEELKKMYTRITIALKGVLGLAAKALLEEFSSNEYEGFEEMTFNKIKL